MYDLPHFISPNAAAENLTTSIVYLSTFDTYNCKIHLKLNILCRSAQSIESHSWGRRRALT